VPYIGLNDNIDYCFFILVIKILINKWNTSCVFIILDSVQVAVKGAAVFAVRNIGF